MRRSTRISSQVQKPILASPLQEPPKRVIVRPQRFADIQQSLSQGKYHGRNDQYVRMHIHKENSPNTNTNVSSKLSGYVSDGGFVVSHEVILSYDDMDYDKEEDEVDSDSDSEEEDDFLLETDTEE
jgi:hypothetical protein